MSAAYIVCKVFSGLFDTEYYVTVNGSSAYYVNSGNVRPIVVGMDEGAFGRSG